jgi:hypothetical protein
MAENWSLRGEYLAACNCRVSPCPCTTAGGDPTEDECNGLTVLSIREGSYGDVDLSRLNFAIFTRWTGNVLAGNWDVGLLLDEGCDDRQFDAMQTIVSGQAGGTFGELAGLIGTILGTERARISFETSDGGESGSVRIDASEFSYTPLKSQRGERTRVVHAALAFRDEIYPGKAEGGRIERFGLSAPTDYGEWSEFEFSGP